MKITHPTEGIKIMSAIREYLEEKAALPEKEWLRREPKTTHSEIMDAVRAFENAGGGYDDEAERCVENVAGDLPEHHHHAHPARDRITSQLGHEVYIARGLLRDEERALAARELIEEGYRPLTDIAELSDGARYLVRLGQVYSGADVPEYGPALQVRVKAGMFMKKGARTHGFIPFGPALVREVS